MRNLINNDTKIKLHNAKLSILEGNIKLSELISKFLSNLNIKGYIFVIANVKLLNGEMFSLGKRYPLEISNPDNYIDYLNNHYAMLENRYKVVPAINIFFNYAVIDKENYLQQIYLLDYDNISKTPIQNITDEKPAFLPLNTNYLTWGESTSTITAKILRIADLYIDEGTELVRHVKVTYLNKLSRKIELFSTLSGMKLYTVVDKIIDNVSGNFIREIGDTLYYIKESSVYFIFNRIYDTTDKIKKGRLDTKFSLNMLTLDIETHISRSGPDSSMSVYCISIYDGKKATSFYITDYKSIHELLSDLLKAIFVRKNHQKTVYIHKRFATSDFDMIFLLKSIVNHKECEVEPVIKDGKFINVKVLYGPKNRYYINFKDSFLLLPLSLSKLSKQFEVNTLKSIFPHKIVTKDNLNYLGSVPAYEFFDSNKVTLSEYQTYCKDFTCDWSLRRESVKYCEIDCIALYEVIETFSKLIFDKFKVNVSSVSTLPSLAFKIFRTNYLDKYLEIPVLSGKIYNDISNAYYGGHVDMYIPSNPKGELVYHYDVNALYPYVMKTFNYPTRLLAHFKGNISVMPEYLKIFNSKLSVILVKVTTPKGLVNPILPYKVNGTTIYPEGTWTAWYYSDEINNAKNFGYTFEILEGYIFESINIFDKYIEDINKIKVSNPSNTPWYIIAKLLMNSLV